MLRRLRRSWRRFVSENRAVWDDSVDPRIRDLHRTGIVYLGTRGLGNNFFRERKKWRARGGAFRGVCSCGWESENTGTAFAAGFGLMHQQEMEREMLLQEESPRDQAGTSDS